jgi:hypothetical protein
VDEDLVDDRENGGVGADREGQCADNGKGQAEGLMENADAISEV